MMLDDLIPGLSTARWIGIGVAAALIVGGFTWAGLTIKGWRDDSVQLPQIKQQRDDAVAAKAKLDADMTAKLTDISKRLGEIDAMRDALLSVLANNKAALDASLADFRKRFPNGSPQNPSCPVPQSLRDGLRSLFPVQRPAQPGADVRHDQGGPAAGAPGTVGRVEAVPGRQHAPADGFRVGVSAAPGAPGRAGQRQSIGYRVGGDHRPARRDQSALSPSALGLALAGARGAIGAAVTAGMHAR